MKMKPEDLDAMRRAVENAIAERRSASRLYQEQGLSLNRYRWDMLHVSHFDLRPLYEYLNDSHIETALRRIVPEFPK